MGAYSLPDGTLASHQRTSQIIRALETPQTLEKQVACPSGSSRPVVVSAQGHRLFLEDGREILDACGGAAVSCLGYGDREVLETLANQAAEVPYVPWAFFDTHSTRQLSDWLIKSTGRAMGKVYIMSSGSDAVEGALKLAREYFVWKDQPKRVNFIARHGSYHGTTLGALSLSGHVARRAPFEDLLSRHVHRVSSCNAYRQRRAGESDAAFCARKARELEDVFIKLGPETVAAFVVEPVVGAALGCVPAVPGYLKAMKAVCDKYGALFVLDEIMSGMGRTGTLHAWEQEGVVPDIQTIGKGLGAGYQPVSAVLAGRRIVEEMEKAGTAFNNGHTYQDFPVAAATALKVQEIIQERNLLQNVVAQGEVLGRKLQERLGHHPNVGDIRGRGLFWGVEFVKDRTTKEPFDESLRVSKRIHDAALGEPYNIMVYHGQGCAGGWKGDHIMLCPAYDVSAEEVEVMVDRVSGAVEEVFASLVKLEKLVRYIAAYTGRAMVREIITLQLGELSNYVATHFWNAQESYFTYGDEEKSPVDHNVHWRQGIGADGSETFLPRALIYDFRSNYGPLGRSNPLYENEDDDPNRHLWHGNAAIHKQPPIPKSPYHAALEAGTVPALTTASVRYWSDFTRPYFHPRSIVQLSDLEGTPAQSAGGGTGGAPTLDSFEHGKELFKAVDAADDVLDGQLRAFVEECDLLQGMQVVVGGEDGWSGFGAGLLERVRDEYGKSCVWVWMPDGGAGGNKKEKQLLRLINKAKSLTDSLPLASTLIPSPYPRASDPLTP
ncbi:hypothetical protein jhhlp_000249 [Lomentospora prolificans]|uniref:Uncharacterized protein n=1 Tax=Lomentospora prolificans TaxID=41688 RepID=A0A2N3NKF6_9PEZI|nr:hypothetical protein jhhlp_000249 [Lomentospora prolificans]